jgi:hypothetical protein
MQWVKQAVNKCGEEMELTCGSHSLYCMKRIKQVIRDKDSKEVGHEFMNFVLFSQKMVIM